MIITQEVCKFLEHTHPLLVQAKVTIINPQCHNGQMTKIAQSIVMQEATPQL